MLQAIRSYVRFFFGCRECAGHFERMAAASMNRVKNPNSAVLWFWSSHNKVNARLAGKEGPPPRLESATEEEEVGELWSPGAEVTPVFPSASQHTEPFHMLCQPCRCVSIIRPIFQVRKLRL